MTKEKTMPESITELTLVWNMALKKIKGRIADQRIFDSFFYGSYPISISGNTMTVVANSDLAKIMLETKYRELVESALVESSETNLAVTFVTEEEKSKVAVTAKPKSDFFSKSTINPRFTFDNFVVGGCNLKAYQASLLIANNPGELYNPLLIYSASGLGKTHLLEGIGNAYIEARQTNGKKAKALYISASEFVDEYVKFAKGYNEDQSLVTYFKEEVDILLIDDIQFLVGKKKTMEMFFVVFQALYSQGKQIVITSDQPPENLDGLDERLKTRFQQGLVLSMTKPDVETSKKILIKKIEANGLDVGNFDEDVLDFLAEHFSSSVRELEGSLNRLIFHAINLEKADKVTVSVATKAMQGLIDDHESQTKLSETKIINTVANYYNMTPSQITGKIRTSQIALARHVAMYLIREMLNTPYTKIGAIFGGKDHATVMNGVQKVEKFAASDPDMATAIAELKRRLQN